MDGPPRPRASEPDEATSADERMAEILRGHGRSRQRQRDALRDEATAASDDVLGRMNALEFVDSLVGEVTEMPDRLGDYRIRGLLGRGGMGTVYEAFQESLEREVALKVLSPTYTADVTMRERFRIEARATASLHHEHIVPVYDFGESGGVLYFAMEKVNGVSLDRHIAAARRHGRPAMEPREAAARFAGVAEALSHAHRRRILHRDVKPGNLLVAPDGTLALADFGLSKVVGEVSRGLTAGGAFLGTLSYAPPEQARGQQPTPASDLYSLGVTIFEAVTGELPLSGPSTEAMLDAVLHGTPRRLRDALPRAPRDLEAVLDKLLQKEPADRYGDAEELARDLQRIAEGEPVRIRRQPLWLRTWRRARKNPALSLTIAVASLLAVVTLVLAVVTSRQHRTSVEARYANHLQRAMTAASRQAGAPQGPAGLLLALTGVRVDGSLPPDQVLQQLDQAEKLAPDRPEAPRLREAYVADALPEATEALRRGAGHRARQLLDRAIEAGRAGFETGDQPTWLRLYGFYVARAAASLTASVARIDDAKMDLSAASIIRSGAFFPKLLLACVDWASEPGSVALLARVTAVVRSGPEGSEQAAGALLRAFSGLGRPSGCNLLEIAMPYSERVAIHAAAQRMLGEAGAPPEGGTRSWSGLENELAGVARDATRVFGDRLQLSSSLTAGQEILQRDVDPTSPLQSWRFVFDLLADPYATAAQVPDEDAAALRRQVRGWIDLLRLDPPRVFVQSMAPRIEEMLQRHPQTPRAPELRGLLVRRIGSASALHEAARVWYEAEPGHPGALLCRFQALVMRDEVLEARYCAGELLQKVVDRAPMLQEIVQVLRAAEQRDRERWQPVRERFEQLGGVGG